MRPSKRLWDAQSPTLLAGPLRSLALLLLSHRSPSLRRRLREPATALLEHVLPPLWLTSSQLFKGRRSGAYGRTWTKVESVADPAVAPHPDSTSSATC